MTDDELTESERSTLETWTTLTPPPGFADRVLAAREVPTRRRWPIAVAALAAAAAVVTVIASTPWRGGSHAANGELVATARTTAKLGDRAVVVAEPAAALRWTIDDDGAAQIDQTSGDVFYRVDRGDSFVVHTPAGDIRVTGTCFRIEVPMTAKKQLLLSGTAGALIAAAVVVTVYEGHVVAETREGKTEVVAGARATLGRDGRTVLEPGAPPPTIVGTLAATAPDENATREQLLERSAAQRIELAKLRQRLGQLEGGRGHDNTTEEGRHWYDPSAERLREWAGECHVRADEPGFDRFQPLKSAEGNRRGLEPKELDAWNAAMTEVYQPYKALVRALYIETTGDAAGADTLSIDAMRGEIQEKSAPNEHNLVLQRIANERAGLLTPPADLSKTSPIERMFRAVIQLGDQAEAALAKRLGPERAKELRGDAWDHRSDWSGCPNER